MLGFLVNLKTEISKRVNPFEETYTAPKPNKALCARPIINALTKPKGDKI